MPDATRFLQQCSILTGGKPTLQILKEALELLVDPDRWTKYTRARASDGTPVRPEDPTAVCWCVEGAVAVLSNEYGVLPPQLMKALDRAVWSLSGEYLSAGVYNDKVTHPLVLLLLQEAIQLEELIEER